MTRSGQDGLTGRCRRPCRPGPLHLLLLSILVAGCADRGDPPPRTSAAVTVTVDTTASGVVRVVSEGEPPRLELDEVLTLGSVGGMGEPAPDEFAQVSSVSIGPGGRLWVADQGNAEIRVFGPDGTLERVVGREGEGPGEFLSLYSLAWVGDTLLALDLGNGRVAELSSDGQWLGQRPAPGRVTGSPAMLRLHRVGPDEVVQWTLVPDEEVGMRRLWIRHGPGGVIDELPQLGLEPPEPTRVVCRHDARGSIHFLDMPFGARTYELPAPGGRLWVAWSGVYRMALVEPGGDTVRVVERVAPPVPVTDAEWKEASGELDELREEVGGGLDCDPEGFVRPDTKPAFAHLFVDVTGRLWAERITADGSVWEVFDREGRLVAAVPAFDFFDRSVPWLSPDVVAWVSADTVLEVPRVHLARVEGR